MAESPDEEPVGVKVNVTVVSCSHSSSYRRPALKDSAHRYFPFMDCHQSSRQRHRGRTTRGVPVKAQVVWIRSPTLLSDIHCTASHVNFTHNPRLCICIDYAGWWRGPTLVAGKVGCAESAMHGRRTNTLSLAVHQVLVYNSSLPGFDGYALGHVPSPRDETSSY